MRRRSRLLRVAKWAGAAASLIVVVTWLISAWWEFTLFGGRAWLIFSSGDVSFLWFEEVTVNSYGWRENDQNAVAFFGTLWPNHGALLTSRGTASFVSTPLFLVFFLVAASTVLLWRLDRRRRFPPNHCQRCGYNLTGNVSGVCPECGAAV